jgi:hypothetical protein
MEAMSLTEFLLARLDEDEEQAKRSKADDAMNPNLRIPAGWVAAVADRMLAEVEAKRQIVEEHAGNERVRGEKAKWPGAWACEVCEDGPGMYAGDIEHQTLPCPTLRALTAVYSDHPDYDEAWRP